MSLLDHYTRRSGFTPVPAVRRLIAKVQTEASMRANRGELGAWMFTFARVATMTETELKERGCPGDQIEPLLRFAMERAVRIVAPAARREIDPETMRQTSEFIVRIAQLTWGSEAADDAFCEWLDSGFGHLPASVRRDPRARRLSGMPELGRRQ
jgi:hypothetical protein